MLKQNQDRCTQGRITKVLISLRNQHHAHSYSGHGYPGFALVRRSRSAVSTIVSALILSLTLAFSALSGRAERVEDLPKPTDYISDFAHVLSPETVARLGALCGQLDHSKTNAQVAIVTIKTLDGDDVSDFANRLEEK